MRPKSGHNQRQMNGGLGLFERKGLGCIFGAKQGTAVWQKRYNYELYDTFNEPDIVCYFKMKTLAWSRHVMCMDSDRTLKKILNSKPEGVRSVRRPELRWEDGVC